MLHKYILVFGILLVECFVIPATLPSTSSDREGDFASTSPRYQIIIEDSSSDDQGSHQVNLSLLSIPMSIGSTSQPSSKSDTDMAAATIASDDYRDLGGADAVSVGENSELLTEDAITVLGISTAK